MSEAQRLDLHTGLPGRVRSFDLAAQTADIELCASRVIPAADDTIEDTTEAYPILPSVPIRYPAGGGFRMSWPLSAGDWVWVDFSECDLGQWRATGQISDPGLSTRHGLSGAVATPGIHHRGSASTTATASTLRIEREGGPVFEITGSEVRCGGSAALAEAADVRAHLQAIATAITGLVAPSGGGPCTTPSPYIYATTIAASPIDTTVTRGT